jgi:hypothetical protein
MLRSDIAGNVGAVVPWDMRYFLVVALLALGIAACSESAPTGIQYKEPAAGVVPCGPIIVERENVRRGEPTLDTIPCHYLAQP